MRGVNIGFIGRVNQLLKTRNIEPSMYIQCKMHHQGLCGKVIGYKNVMDIVTNTINFIRPYGLTH